MSTTPEVELEVEPITPETVEEFKEMMKRNGIHDTVSEVIVKDSGLRGENMTSKTNCVTIIFENPDKKPLELFMKTAFENNAMTDAFAGAKLFEKEARFFMEYLPEAREFCKSLGQEKLMDIYPKCYFGDVKKLVFENLVVEKGFSLLNKMERQDFEAACLSLKALAKHHAISRAFIKKAGGEDKFFKRFEHLNLEAFKLDAMRAMFGPGMESGLSSNADLIEKLLKTKDAADAVEMLNGCRDRSYDLFIEPLTRVPEDEKLLLLNHGDYWNNNMMFKKDANGKLIGHIMIDFQVLRYATPSTDISYLLFTSVKQDVRIAKLKELLEVYLNAVNTVSNDLGYPFDLTYDELFMDFRRKFNYGFWVSVMMGNGIGFAVSKYVKPEELMNMDDFVAKFSELVDRWIKENEDEARAIAESSVLLVREYNDLKIKK